MKDKEAKARIKVNQLLLNAGWRFFDTPTKRANIQLELNVKLVKSTFDDLGNDFEYSKNGFVDYLLLDEKGNPLVVVEAKRANMHPLDGKEQARNYAISLRAKYIILTNGDIHYFWNLRKGNPEIITAFPSYESLISSKALNSSTKAIITEKVDKYYIALSQELGLESTSEWKSENDVIITEYCLSRGIRILRYYQLNAVHSIQKAIKDNKTRFLFEMATGARVIIVTGAMNILKSSVSGTLEKYNSCIA